MAYLYVFVFPFVIIQIYHLLQFYIFICHFSVNITVVIVKSVSVFCCDMMQKCMPIYNTMFSDLRRYPRCEVRLDTVDLVPRFIARQWRGKQTDAQDSALPYQTFVPFVA